MESRFEFYSTKILTPLRFHMNFHVLFKPRNWEPRGCKKILLIKAKDVRLEESDSIPRFTAVCDL